MMAFFEDVSPEFEVISVKRMLHVIQLLIVCLVNSPCTQFVVAFTNKSKPSDGLSECCKLLDKHSTKKGLRRGIYTLS